LENPSPNPPQLTQIAELCARVMNIATPGPDDDLVASGHLDSLALVELLFQLEQVLGVTPSLDDLDLEQLRTPRSIACFAAASQSGAEGVA
jgi:acyl carrier protein